MRDKTDNEMGGFGISKPDDLLYVNDFVLVKQKVSTVSVLFEDESVADFFEDQVQVGRKPEQFARIWLHTHPGDSAKPSSTDEETFQRVFGKCDWSVMCIVAQDGSIYAKLKFNLGPCGEVRIPVFVDYSCEFDAADFELWKQQYKANISKDEFFKQQNKKRNSIGSQKNSNDKDFSILTGDDLLEEIEKMAPIEREIFMDELAIRSDFWDQESEVLYG